MDEVPHSEAAAGSFDLELHPNSPGYRLILNNVLFPAAKKKELKEKKEAFEAKKIVSDPKDIQQEEAALYREAQMFMQQFQMSQQELTYLEKQLADQMLVRIERVVNQISLEKGYDYVFEVGFDGEPNVLYSARGIDITRSVIKTYEKAYKGKPLQDPKLPQGRPGK